MTTWMLPVDKQADGTWKVDVDPILHGDDMDRLEDYDHLPQIVGVVRGVPAKIFTPDGTSGYVRADAIPETEPTP